MKTYDFIVIGTGIAGLSVAMKAASHGTVAVLTKRAGTDSNTNWAQGGIACVTGTDDSVDRHVTDTLDAGAGLCDRRAVETIIGEGPERIQELIEIGVEFDQHEVDGHLEFDLGREGGHTRRRVLHSADHTGREISEKLLAAARATDGIDFLEQHFVVDLITTSKIGFLTEDRAVGLYALDQETGNVETFRSDRIILCTGGCGRVYQYTTNPDVATGDGVAMAWRAGATVANMEFIQFHPTCLYHPRKKSFLITEALRGEGARLIDHRGREFVHESDPRGALAPRDIVARAIDSQIKISGHPCVYLDVSHKDRAYLAERFPTVYMTCEEIGIDPASDPIPVVPAAHYQCGGVRTTVDGNTSLRGLYAVGEVACTGLHGANRLASNSLLEGAVVANRAVEHMCLNLPLHRSAGDFPLPPWQSGDAQDVDELVVIYHNWDEIRRLMWDYVSIARTGKRLQRAAARLHNLKREVHEFYWNFKITTELLELRNLVQTAALIVECASRRHESRGLHYTRDYPKPDDTRPPADTLVWRY